MAAKYFILTQHAAAAGLFFRHEIDIRKVVQTFTQPRMSIQMFRLIEISGRVVSQVEADVSF